MPPPKKAAKKAPAKSSPKHDEGKNLRRAYEHRGRIEVLRPLLGKNTTDIEVLIELGERELAGSHPNDAADLLRAAEHLSFGYLASSKPDEHVHPKLSYGIEEEFHRRLENAEEHWEESEALPLIGIYQNALDEAHRAFNNGSHRRAVEMIRAAEAIAHVHLHDD